MFAFSLSRVIPGFVQNNRLDILEWGDCIPCGACPYPLTVIHAWRRELEKRLGLMETTIQLQKRKGQLFVYTFDDAVYDEIVTRGFTIHHFAQTHS
jgi:hypothetical protein